MPDWGYRLLDTYRRITDLHVAAILNGQRPLDDPAYTECPTCKQAGCGDCGGLGIVRHTR